MKSRRSNIFHLAFMVTALMVISACTGTLDKNQKTLPAEHTRCSSCHEFSRDTARTVLIDNKTPDELCRGCHSARVATGEHKVGMAVKEALTNLPLVDGKVACISCHEPHGLSGFPSLLRTEPAAICTGCHNK